MKRYFTPLLTLFLTVSVLSGCSDSSSKDDEDVVISRNDRDADTPGEELDEALNELGSALEQLGQSMNGENNVEPVDHRDLRDILPERIRGFEKGDYNGERAGSMGFKISKVEQEFEGDDGESIDIAIVDLGSLKNIASFGVDWLNLEIDRESNDGFERTTKIDGHPALEKCESNSRYERCEVHLFVSERFVVEVETKGLSPDELRDVLDDIDLRKLAKMRNE